MSSIADTFNRADADALGTSSDGQFTWTETVGDLDIVSNQCKGISATVYAQAAFNLASDDHYAQADFHTDFNIGLLVRFADADNQYLLQVNGTNVQLYKRVAGGFTQLGGNAAITFSAGEAYKLECNGSAIKCYEAGVERISQTDTSLTGQLRTGLRGGGVNQIWDNFAAADLAAGAAVNRIRFPAQMSAMGVGGMLGGNRVH